MTGRVLVTGATGFVGSHVCRGLLGDGSEVHILVRPTSKFDLLHDIEDRLRVHIWDGTMPGMQRILEDARPEAVFHLASLFLSGHTPDDIEPLIASNVLFGTQLVEAAVAAGCTEFINTGTSWQHYEDEDYNPVNLYAATKQAFTDILRYYAEAQSLKVVTLKLFDTFGPDDPRPKLIRLLRRAAETGEELSMSPGEQRIDLVHVDEVVRDFLTARRRVRKIAPGTMEEYGVGTGNPIRLKDLVRQVEQETGKTIRVIWGGRPYRDREVMEPWSRYQRIGE